MGSGSAAPHPRFGRSGELWSPVHRAQIHRASHIAPELSMVPGVIAITFPTDTELFDLAHNVLHGDPHFGDLMIQLAVVRTEPATLGAHPGDDHFVLGAELVQPLIPTVAPDATSTRQAGRESRLLQEGEQSMNVATDVGDVHLEQHTQEMHGEVTAQVEQSQEQAMGNVEFELTASSDLTLPSHPQEGETMSSNPEGLETLRQVGELRGGQAAKRFEGPRALHETLDLKHAVTLFQLPQLRNGS